MPNESVPDRLTSYSHPGILQEVQFRRVKGFFVHYFRRSRSGQYTVLRFPLTCLGSVKTNLTLICPPPNRLFVLGFWQPLACVASVSVRFRSKERGTRVKDRAKNGASKWLSFQFSRGQNRKSRSSGFFCSETKRKRLLRRLGNLVPRALVPGFRGEASSKARKKRPGDEVEILGDK